MTGDWVAGDWMTGKQLIVKQAISSPVTTGLNHCHQYHHLRQQPQHLVGLAKAVSVNLEYGEAFQQNRFLDVLG